MQNTKRHVLGHSICIALLFGTTLSAQEKAPVAYDGPKENLHIYLLIGQSNMAGRAPFTKEETGVVSSEGLKAMDRWHFDAKSMKLLGRRYAEEVLKIQIKQKAEGMERDR